MRVWLLLRDILLTGTGVWVILSQVLSPRPSDILLVAGLALTVPSVAGHAGALLAGRPAPSSPPSPSSTPSPSGPSPEEAAND